MLANLLFISFPFLLLQTTKRTRKGKTIRGEEREQTFSQCRVSDYMVPSRIKHVTKIESCTCEARSLHLLQRA